MSRRRKVRLLGFAAFVTVGLGSAWPVIRPPSPSFDPPQLVNDVTRLNPVTVGGVLQPTTTNEIVNAVRSHSGPIAIGGSRHSMGGQIVTAGALFLDMRRFNRILAFDPAAKRITVQAGARWRDIQERIDPAGLSVAIMQSPRVPAVSRVGGRQAAHRSNEQVPKRVLEQVRERVRDGRAGLTAFAEVTAVKKSCATGPFF